MPVLAFGQIGEGVSRDLARQRAALITNTRYRLDLELRPKAARMPGHVTIDFDLVRATDSIILDFRDLDAKGNVINGSARNLKINGFVSQLQQSHGHILIPGPSLRPGANSIELDFDSAVEEANRAVTRYIDTQDGNEYLYTLFVPMDASLAFPCFDQPDIKARFSLVVSAPIGWTVVSNGRPAQARASGTLATFRFDETKPISTYLFAFAAGPFERLESSDLHLYVRKSMLARAKEEWPGVADITRKGMGLMETFFAQPFPFPKYDEVLIPGFPYGGMEHAGATFFNEDTILFRTVPTVNDYNRRSETVLHELAHQWFGDLVTMRWFDDLWLKEGFAQYMAYHTLAQMEPPDAVWKRFYQSIKPLAYGIDATHGTTPIYQQIPNLKDAKSAYGAIVYQKAPSLLRVLAFNIGEEHFRDGVRSFLKEHAYANAEWSDLIAAFSRASGTDLKPWARAWVEQRGMPQVEVDWSCNAGHISSFHIRQKDPLGEGHVWPIRTQVLLGRRGAPAERVAASLSGASADVPAAIGKSCPDYVFANDRDEAYGAFLLDTKSQAAVIAELPAVSDPFLRALLWGALWDSVRELRMAPREYAGLALRLLPAEKDAELAVSVLGRLRAAYTDYLSDAQRSALAAPLESLLIREIAEAPTPDLRITYFRGLIAVASTAHGRDALKDLLAGRMTIPGVPLKPRDRWNIIGSLIGSGDSSGAELRDAESRRDTSDDGRKYAYVSGGAFGTPENKKKYFTQYLAAAGGVKEDWITASLPLFNYWSQTSLTAPYLQLALEALPQLKRERKIFFVVNWLSSFVGGQDSPEALKAVDDFLNRNNSDPDLRLKIFEVRDELARTVRIRAKWARN
jgi:aminopeptidase N